MVWASSFSAQRLLSSEIYRASSYSSRQKLSGIQPYLKAKLDRPASRISSSRSFTQLRPYLKERTMAPFRRYRRIYSYLRTEFSRDKFPRLPDDWDYCLFYTERAPQYGRQKSIIKISTQSFQVLNDTLVSPEHTAVEISLENKVLTERLTGFHVDLESKVWSEWNISWLTQFNFGIVVTEQIIALCVKNQ